VPVCFVRRKSIISDGMVPNIGSFSYLNPVRTGVALRSNRRTHSGMQREFQSEAKRLPRPGSDAGFPALNIRLAVVYSITASLIMNGLGAKRPAGFRRVINEPAVVY